MRTDSRRAASATGRRQPHHRRRCDRSPTVGLVKLPQERDRTLHCVQKRRSVSSPVLPRRDANGRPRRPQQQQPLRSEWRVLACVCVCDGGSRKRSLCPAARNERDGCPGGTLTPGRSLRYGEQVDGFVTGGAGTLQSVLLLRSRRGQLLLRAGAPDEAASGAHGARAAGGVRRDGAVAGAASAAGHRERPDAFSRGRLHRVFEANYPGDGARAVGAAASV
eukprot:ctg_377.g238